MPEILISILLFFILIPLVLYITTVAANFKKIRTEWSTVTIKNLIRGYLTAVAALPVALLIRPFLFLNLGFKHEIKGKPILLIHGLYHNKTAWIYIKLRLKRAGMTNIHTLNYNSFTSSYPELVLKAQKMIAKISSSNKNEKVILIGHSLGGLIAAGAASDIKTATLCEQLITLGTPYRGSILAVIAFGHLGRSLNPQSHIFNAGKEFCRDTNFSKTALISPVDEMVLPWKNLVPDTQDSATKWDIVKTPPVSHVSMLYNPETVSRLIAIIKGSH
ncbi:esterase/lipase family protein [Maridesulfovibrio bastinii]|uniref:esterase/lipase family protein n=1 Tax=Maridesulfovibrio bastinii TaxID=47157 RepID=UPI0003F8EFF9|nr:alpha/beta fold hydrolase [Maridesulfovibrio bastinii]